MNLKKSNENQPTMGKTGKHDMVNCYIEEITDVKITQWKQEESSYLRRCKPDEGATVVTGYS